MSADEIAAKTAVEPQVITDTQLAVMLGVTERYIGEISDGIPGACQIGDFRRWNLHAIRPWIDAGCPLGAVDG